MSRYIDADKIPYVISENGCLDDFAYRYDINEVPTADVVEVVRCKDCKYLKYGYQCYRPLGMNLSNNEDAYVLLDTENDYCSYGERRADNGKL